MMSEVYELVDSSRRKADRCRVLLHFRTRLFSYSNHTDFAVALPEDPPRLRASTMTVSRYFLSMNRSRVDLLVRANPAIFHGKFYRPRPGFCTDIFRPAAVAISLTP